jgi:ribose transport system substrate-binding protein
MKPNLNRLSAAVGCLASLAVGSLLEPTRVRADDAKAYTAVIVNNFMGNSWRALMERSAQLLIDQPPLKGRIKDLRIINTDNTAAAQNAVISNLILDKPDILLLEAASTTASNQAIQQACDAGIVVITYDQLADAPCAWKLAPDFTEVGAVEAKWLVKQIDGKGTVFLDMGLAGASPAIDAMKGAHSVFDKYSDIKLVPYYSNFSPGEEQSQVASLIPAHPDVKGILTLHAGAYALDALKAAGHGPVPVTGYSFAEGILKCQKEKLVCLFKSVPAWVSASALILGVDILDGKKTGKPGFVLLDTPWITNTDLKGVYDGPSPIMTLDAAAVDLEPGTMLPLSPPWAKLDLKEVTKPPVLK